MFFWFATLNFELDNHIFDLQCEISFLGNSWTQVKAWLCMAMMVVGIPLTLQIENHLLLSWYIKNSKRHHGRVEGGWADGACEMGVTQEIWLLAEKKPMLIAWNPTTRPGWWFGTFFICPYIGNNNPNWLIFFRGVGIPPTSQSCIPYSPSEDRLYPNLHPHFRI